MCLGINEDQKQRELLIYKKGMREDPGNYRSISITSVPGKSYRKDYLERY